MLGISFSFVCRWYNTDWVEHMQLIGPKHTVISTHISECKKKNRFLKGNNTCQEDIAAGLHAVHTFL